MKEQHIQWASRHDWYVGHGVDSENRVFIRVKARVLSPYSTIDCLSLQEIVEAVA